MKSVEHMALKSDFQTLLRFGRNRPYKISLALNSVLVLFGASFCEEIHSPVLLAIFSRPIYFVKDFPGDHFVLTVSTILPSFTIGQFSRAARALGSK